MIRHIAVLSCVLLLSSVSAQLKLQPGDHISYIGNTTADRMQHHAWLETYLHALHPDHELTFRNLAVPGDELKSRPREDNFGSPDQWLSKNKTDVVFAFFGYNEALKGTEAIDGFRRDLADVIKAMKGQKYNGKSAPRIVMFSPIGHENLQDPNLPDGSENNVRLNLYTAAMRSVCQEQGVAFVNLFDLTQQLYSSSEKPLTMNGIHLLDHGNEAVAREIVKQLLAKEAPAADSVGKLREAVQEKNYYWFNRYRVVDGYNVFGGRSRLAWFGQSNADVMMREMEIFDIMTANRDARVWAVAGGGDLEVKDDNIPEELVVKSNKKGDLPDGSFSYRTAEEGLKLMKLDEGLQANVFASEEMFPELINPVQMAVDTDGRLFASVWPSYPHWNPTKPRTDRIVCLPDDDGDGVADRCVIFADGLNSVTGFEFWGGGMIVAALPELWFLKDTDGDDRADVKIRLLQGLSSADSHHSANAMVVGPDGWVYWSRGIFNVAAMETPTTTYRSGRSGVHRFNPRTFEMEFHFPIGPNPHGDIFDQWGFQFANDGTSGTGSYVNIGKGIGNKQWFRKEWRPVAATGILSSSHFPERHQGNFLVCNCIGFLGILQHEVKYNGADITAEKVPPLLDSKDPNFRPTDVEIGADGALYVSDWANALIGHMQHNMRDPNRDASHGRIYRITAKGRPLLKPVRLKGKPVTEVCKAFYAPENSTRYRARLELSGRESASVTRDVKAWASVLNVEEPKDAQALLECLWVLEEHRRPDLGLLGKVFLAKESRVRAAAIRTLGHWARLTPGGSALLVAAARDDSALVRAEALKAAVEFQAVAADVDLKATLNSPRLTAIFEAAVRDKDEELITVLNYAKGQINVDQLINQAIARKIPLSKAAYGYALNTASPADLLKLQGTPELYTAILSRPGVPEQFVREAVNGLAKLKKASVSSVLVDAITEMDGQSQTATISGPGRILAAQPNADLKQVQQEIEALATRGATEEGRQIGYAAWVAAEGNGAAALFSASRSKDSLRDFLASVPRIPEGELRAGLYADVRALMFELPPGLEPEPVNSGQTEPGIHVDYYYPAAGNVAIETLERMTPKDSGVVPEIIMNVPQRKDADKFALKFSGMISVPKSGRYTFSIASDDGSRIYLDGKLLVNNDGLHGMVEKSGSVNLAAGAHDLVVTYFDNGGGDGLSVAWAGPGFGKQKIAKEALSLSGGSETIHDVAIRALGAIPGNEAGLFNDLADLLKAGRNQSSSVAVLSAIPQDQWVQTRIPGLVDNLIGYLSEIPARYRTGASATAAIELTKALSTKLSADAGADALERLQNLDVRVIALGTVPARMLYDKERIVVEAGKPVEFRFSNTDHMPHNFAIVEPGFLQEVGELAEKTARDAGAKERHFIPESERIILGSRLLESGEKQAISYTAPAEPGIYPYVCTYPGHWRRMFGAMYVVESLEQYNADPVAYLKEHPAEAKDELLTYLDRNTEWKLSDLAGDVMHLGHRSNSFDVGEKLFSVASCIGCHRMNGKGANVGPDLTKLPAEYKPVDVLQHILDPSKKIDRKYQSNLIVLKSGKVVAGLVVKEDDTSLHVLDNPTAPDRIRVIAKDELEEREVSEVSIMPKGVLNKLTREEILDLLAFVVSRGDKKSDLFKAHHHGE